MRSLDSAGFEALFSICPNCFLGKFRQIKKASLFDALKGVIKVIDKRIFNNNIIQTEMCQETSEFWFDFKRQKFLHNIDTFYYSVKFENDFRAGSSEPEVKRLRSFFMHKLETIKSDFDGLLSLYFPEAGTLNLRPFSFSRWYTICLELPEYFDLFIAPVVPPDSEGNESVTCEWIVQIRSYMLWMYGVHGAFEKSYEVIKAIAAYFNLTISYVQENRVDYCWHSNYLSNPEKFFNPDNFYKMRVDRFRDAFFHTGKVGEDGHEIDYIAMGKRSEKVFIRIYLKSKEVVEQNYKPWFFKVWLFHGLINRYDMYVYEEAFLKRSWQYVDYARLQFYLEHGQDEVYKSQCKEILYSEKKVTADVVKKLADRLTPKINLVINVEYQTMRKHTKSYELLPLKDNSSKGACKRIYDYLDNRKLIIDYLTMHVFRLVQPDDKLRKKDRDMVGFWKALRRTRLVDVLIPPEQLKLVRTYTHKLNSQFVKERSLKAAVTLGIYQKGINNDSPIVDFTETLCILNDNDVENALRYKKKKISKLNPDELANVEKFAPAANYTIVDKDTGEVFLTDNVQ